MAKKSKSPVRSKSPAKSAWTDRLDAEEVQAAYEDATVDSYGEDEQHTGLLTMIQEALVFPFRATVLGDDVTIVDMEWPEDDEYGLDLIVERKGKRHRIEARSVQLTKPLPEGHLYLAAYLDWKRRQ